MTMYRDQTIDLMKGIAILAMIAGHCFIPLLLHDFIYLWHMPLFFIVSGFFFRDKTYKEIFSSIWRGLIVPYIFTSAVLLSIFFITDCVTGKNFFLNKLINQLAITGLMPKSEVYGEFLYNAGPIWFLLALAWCRGIYAIIYKMFVKTNVVTFVVVIVSFGGWFWGRNHFLPFFLSQGMVGMIFYHIGYLIGRNKKGVQDNFKIILGLGLCSIIVGMLYCKMDIWGLWMSFWPANVLIAVLISLAIYVTINKMQLICMPYMQYVAYLGRVSILILALHTIEKSFDIIENGMDCLFFIEHDSIGYRFLKIILQFSFCLIGLSLIKRDKLICYIFNIK